MNDPRNRQIYRNWAPLYDRVMRPVYGSARRRAIALLNLQHGESVLIPGIGTGLDLPLIPSGVRVTGIDFSPEMLGYARTKAENREITLLEMNAQALQFPADCFDAVILNLILSVVPDGAAAFREAWRVLRPGGRAVIFDKFIPETSQLTPVRRLIGLFVRTIGTDPNRRLSDILRGAKDVAVERDEPSLLGGQYRILVLRKVHKG